MLSKYSFPEVFRDLLTTALEAEVLDPTELYLLGMGFGQDLIKATETVANVSKAKVRARKQNHKNIKRIVKAAKIEQQKAIEATEVAMAQHEKSQGESVH